METVSISVVEPAQVVTISVVTGFATVVNSDNTYSLNAPVGATSILPDITVTDSDGSTFTQSAVTDVVCSLPVGSDVENSDASYTAHVNNGATLTLPDTTVKNTAGTTILVQPSATSTGVIADCRVVNSDLTYDELVPAETTHNLADVPNVDSDGSIVMTPAMTPFVATPAATPEGWYPPADWGWDAASALIGDGDNGFVALVAVYPDSSNLIKIRLGFASISGTIDWGDGTTEAITSTDTSYSHDFNYAGISSAITAGGFKCAVVKVLSSAVFTIYYPTYHALQNAGIASNVLALKICTINSAFDFLHVNIEPSKLSYLEFGSNVRMRSFYLSFVNMNGLKILKYNWALGFNTNNNRNPFKGCYAEQCYFNDYSFANFVSLYFFFAEYKSGGTQYFNNSISACTNMYAAFYLSNAFSKIKLTSTALVSDLQYAIYGAISVVDFEMDNCASVTNTSNFIQTSGTNKLLSRLILGGLTIGINISGCGLSATALNAFFTSLGTANGAQTITVTGNPGAATCDTTIATAKGFTVVT